MGTVILKEEEPPVAQALKQGKLYSQLVKEDNERASYPPHVAVFGGVLEGLVEAAHR